jgi:hypothetical protein
VTFGAATSVLLTGGGGDLSTRALQKVVGTEGIVETPKNGLTSQVLCHKGFRPTKLLQ